MLLRTVSVFALVIRAFAQQTASDREADAGEWGPSAGDPFELVRPLHLSIDTRGRLPRPRRIAGLCDLGEELFLARGAKRQARFATAPGELDHDD